MSTNGGYPLDRNLYQAVKGMAAAERIVRPGGIIVMAAACLDGVPADGAFARTLAAASTPADLGGAPARPSSTAGRRRCSATSCNGPRSGSSAMASVGARGGHARSSRWSPTSTARLRRPWVASGPGPGWLSCPKARSRWRRSAPQAHDAALPRDASPVSAGMSCGPHRQTDA